MKTTFRITFIQVIYGATEVKVATLADAEKCAEYFVAHGDQTKTIKWRRFGDYPFSMYNIQEVKSK